MFTARKVKRYAWLAGAVVSVFVFTSSRASAIQWQSSQPVLGPFWAVNNPELVRAVESQNDFLMIMNGSYQIRFDNEARFIAALRDLRDQNPPAFDATLARYSIWLNTPAAK